MGAAVSFLPTVARTNHSHTNRTREAAYTTTISTIPLLQSRPLLTRPATYGP